RGPSASAVHPGRDAFTRGGRQAPSMRSARGRLGAMRTSVRVFVLRAGVDLAVRLGRDLGRDLGLGLGLGLRLALCIGLGLAGCASTPPHVGHFEASDRVAIQAVLDSQIAAWNHGDLPGYMDGYARIPGLIFTSGGDIRRGWQEALDHYQARYAIDP